MDSQLIYLRSQAKEHKDLLSNFTEDRMVEWVEYYVFPKVSQEKLKEYTKAIIVYMEGI